MLYKVVQKQEQAEDGSEHHDSDPLAPTRGIINAIAISLSFYGVLLIARIVL